MEKVIAECLESLGDMEKWDEKIFEVVCKTASGCCRAVLEALDDELFKTRDKELKVIGKRERTLVTKFGYFKVKRRLYKKNGKSRFLLDESLGLNRRKQATPSLEETALALSSKLAFREAAAVLEGTSGGVLSHQMIHRILLSAGETLENEERQETEELLEDGVVPPGRQRHTNRLYVEADGTVINLQRSPRKKTELKLLVSHEGWDRVGKDKWKLKNKTVLCGSHSGKEVWDRFTTHLLKTYRPEALRGVVILRRRCLLGQGGKRPFSRQHLPTRPVSP